MPTPSTALLWPLDLSVPWLLVRCPHRGPLRGRCRVLPGEPGLAPPCVSPAGPGRPGGLRVDGSRRVWVYPGSHLPSPPGPLHPVTPEAGGPPPPNGTHRGGPASPGRPARHCLNKGLRGCGGLAWSPRRAASRGAGDDRSGDRSIGTLVPLAAELAMGPSQCPHPGG